MPNAEIIQEATDAFISIYINSATRTRGSSEISAAEDGVRKFVWPLSKFQDPPKERREELPNGDGKREERERCRVRGGSSLFARLRCHRQMCERKLSASARARPFAFNWKRQWPTYATYAIHFFLVCRHENELTSAEGYPLPLRSNFNLHLFTLFLNVTQIKFVSALPSRIKNRRLSRK